MNKEKTKNNKIISFVILIILIVVILFITIFAVGIYGYKWQGNFTKKVSKIIPYPASLVNYKFLRYYDYLEDRKTLSYYYNKMESINNTTSPTIEEIEQISISRKIKNQFLCQLAKSYKISVSDLEIDQEFDKIISQSESEENVEKILKDLYNWDKETFKKEVLYYYILRSKLENFLIADKNLEVNKKAKEKAEEVLEKINNKENTFENLAKEYSEDATASQGGYLGFFKKGEMVSEFEQAALSLKEGEISDLIRTRFGYHIIKLISKKGEGDDTELETSHILIKTVNIDEFINEKIKEARIYIFLSDLKWNKDLGGAFIPGLNTNTSGDVNSNI